MSETSPLGVRIPRREPPVPGLPVQSRDLRQWIEGVPLASGGKSGQMLLKQLSKLNRTDIPSLTRLGLVDLLVEPVETSVGFLRRRFADTLLPLSDKARVSLMLALRLYAELATGYKVCAHDLALLRLGHQERKALVAALFKAMHRTAVTLRLATLVYRPYPTHLWRDVHAIYLFAAGNKWVDVGVKFLHEGETRRGTVAGEYSRLLAFSVANPYHLRQQEQIQVQRFLDGLEVMAHIRSARPFSPSATRHVILFDEDLPPRPSLIGGVPTPPAAILDAAPLVAWLHEARESLPSDLEGIHPNQEGAGITQGTAERLAMVWGSAGKRRYARTELHFDLKLAVGFSAVHQAMTQGDLGFAGESSLAGIEVVDLRVESDLSSEGDSGLALVPMDEQDSVFLASTDESFGPSSWLPEEPPRIWADPANRSIPKAQILNLRTLNESAGGYCVRWGHTEAPGVGVGYLVGIQATTASSHWSVGVVRWLRDPPGEGLEAGIQLIAVNPVGVRVRDESSASSSEEQAILIPELKSIHRPECLIVPPSRFRDGQRLTLFQGRESREIRLGRALEATGTFVQYIYRVL